MRSVCSHAINVDPEPPKNSKTISSGIDEFCIALAARAIDNWFADNGIELVGRFSDRALARSFLNRTNKIYTAVLGDDNTIWIVKPVDGERLIEMGYEDAMLTVYSESF